MEQLRLGGEEGAGVRGLGNTLAGGEVEKEKEQEQKKGMNAFPAGTSSMDGIYIPLAEVA